MDNGIPDDPVNPRYYQDLSPQPVEVIENWDLGFHLGCAVKYIARAGHKHGEQDILALRKAVWYIERYIARALRRKQSVKAVEETRP